MNNDVSRWDEVHRKAISEIAKHSFYAEGCEKEFPRNCIVCDLGGGLGFDAIYFIKKGHRVILLDISGFALKKAKELGLANNCIKSLLTKQADFGKGTLPLKNSSIDIAFSRIGMNYFPYRETQILMNETYRALKSGGRAYLALKSPNDMDEMKFIKETAVEMEPGVYIEGEQIRSRFSVEQLERMLKEIGIKKFSVKPFQEGPEVARDEFSISKEKPLFLNEVTFTKI